MSFALVPNETALVLIDLEQGIVGRDLAPYTGKEVVERCAKLADAMRKAGGTVVYVHVLLHEIVRPEGDRPMMSPSAPPPPPAASELVPEAGYQPETDVLVAKRQWGAFHATNLDQALRRRGVKTIVLGGIATNIGVESTARSAIEHGYKLVFAQDAMSTMNAEMQAFAVGTLFPLMGYVRPTDDVVAALEGAGH